MRRCTRRFVEVYTAFKSANLADLEPVEVSALYLLAAKSTPEPVRRAALAKAAAGERVTHGSVKEQLREEREQAAHAVDRQPQSFCDTVDALLAEEIKTAPTQGEPEDEEEDGKEDEIDDTEFILKGVADAFKLVEYYRNCSPQEIAGYIDQARRTGVLAKKTKRLGNWFKDLSRWLERA